MITLSSIMALGFFLGMRHATDADHVVAVTTFISRERSVRSAAWIGILWGIGHSLTMFVIGGGIILFGLTIPKRLGLSLEFCVALMLILLGLLNLDRFFRWRRETFGASGAAHDHVHESEDAEVDLQRWLNRQFGKLGWRQTLRPLAVGIVHGLAGSAAVALLVLPVIQNAILAVAYLLVFGIGTIAGMMLITAAIAAPCQCVAKRSPLFSSRIAQTAGFLSLGLGVFLVYQIGFVDGLFTK